MLTNPSQIILRNRELVDNHSVLILNYESDLLPIALLETASSVCALALDYHHHLQLENQQHKNLQLHFGHQLPHDEKFDTVIIYYPKAKSLTGYLINLAGNHLKPEGQLIVTGENKGGIKSITKQMPDYFSQPLKLDNARHCLLFCSELQHAAPSINIKDWTTRYQLDTPQGEITIWGGHDNDIVSVMGEMEEFANTIEVVEQYVREHPDTLVVITADHNTGGLSIGANGVYAWDTKLIKGVSASPKRIAKNAKEDENWQQNMITSLGFTPDSNELQTLADAREEGTKSLTTAIKQLINKKSNTGWTSGGHTGVDVQVFADGPGANLFRGHQDNTDIANKMISLLP